MKNVTVSCKVYYDFSLEVPDDELDDIESYCDSNDPVYQRLCKAFNFEGIDFEGTIMEICDTETGKILYED